MRHKRIGRKLGVTTKHRKSMLRNMVTDLFRNEKLRTTDTRAKEIRRVAEKIITLAKEGTLHKRRQAGAYVRDKEVLKKLFDELAERFKDRPGGYTRITKLGFRKGDNTPISVIELVEEVYKPKKKKKKAAPKKTAKPKVKDDSAKAKSSKKESAEELGLIEEEEKNAVEAAVETAAVAETVDTVTEETPAAEAKTEEVEAVESEQVEQTAEAASEANAQEPATESEEKLDAKAEEISEETTEENPEAEADQESEKKED